ncbi:MAG: pilus assembly protein TadG-related protein [Silvibacterium sp.]
MTNLLYLLGSLRRRVGSENGQVLPMMALLMIGFFGAVAMVIDVGDLYYAHNELVTSTNAAAMAGAEGLGTSSALAQANAYAYGSSAGEKNVYPILNVSEANPVVTMGCLSGGVATGVPCISNGYGSNVNSIQVTQTAKVRTYFAGIFGTSWVTINATSTGLMGTPSENPQNIVVIVDTTGSMKDTDPSCGASRLTCSLAGLQELLGGLSPCLSDGCGSLTSGNYEYAADRVALFSFPELSSSTQDSSDTDCSANTNPQTTPYTAPSPTGTSYNPGTGGTYEVTGFLTNYQNVTSGQPQPGLSNLNGTGSSASGVVEAAGGGGCAAGMGGPGASGGGGKGSTTSTGYGTYYAGVLYAAQAALLAQQAAEAAQGITNVSNDIIILSDGAATASQSDMASTATNKGVYGTTGSYENECQQSVTAANSIKAAGTTIYSIAYGSPTTGCTTDTGKYASPCYSMQQMAGNQASPGLGAGSPYFYSDDSSIGACPSTYYTTGVGGAGAGALGSIFGSILSSFGPPRLVPNGDYPSS